MEALSPRDANAHLRLKQISIKNLVQHTAKPVNKMAQKEKDHPPPPPAEVIEPPSSDRIKGATYKTGKCLGKGGFAICYEGQLAGTRHKFALKIVKSHMPQKKMEQKFQTELQIHSKMHHANIVKFHRAFSYENCTYIVLELCLNGSLMDMVKKRKYITEPEVRFWTVQMAGAIKYMHSKGIIHRDLKMGNIFLDKDMNVKVGDFGLAALLMSGKDMNACRRTTLCGTPNYIAPEILEKGKGGHDHMVDIWSLGIIIFAMLTGKPPFQSTTADEIYRRAREREYNWPKLETSENSISEETKDLVSTLLQDPEKRPDPDAIVQHPFFTCGWMPQLEEMTSALREHHPTPTQFLSVGSRGGKANVYNKNLKKLCMKCEVGPWHTPTKFKSTYREVAAEEQAGLTPQVPLPEDVVYRPFHEWLVEEKMRIQQNDENAIISKTNTIDSVLPLNLPSRSTQSYAAQQRARPQSNQSVRSLQARQPSIESQRSSDSPPEIPLASASKLPTPSIPIRNASNTGHRKISRSEYRVAEKIADVEGRLANDMVVQLNKVEVERKSTDIHQRQSQAIVSIFHSGERVERVSGTKPDELLLGLHKLQAELERALNSRSMALESDSTPATFPIVIKWVDYSNKFGLGYILGNGSIGAILRALPAHPQDRSNGCVPSTGIVIRDAERHVLSRNRDNYVDKHQIVPVSGHNIEFYENRGAQGLCRTKVNPEAYSATVIENENGEKVYRLESGVDEWDERKRERITLWKKFGNYMIAFGRDTDYPSEEALVSKQRNRIPSGNAVIFYQRWGDVGCWAFTDGHYQFNFPDHTKVILSSDGTWCDFYHLPLEAARDLAQTGVLSVTALDDRQRLSYPLQTLLNFMAKPSKSTTRRRPEIDPMKQGVPQANQFRQKIEFIRSVTREWVTNGGLGKSDMTPAGRLRWGGSRERLITKKDPKSVWCTIGASHGDQRRTGRFDPNNPMADVADIEP
ncbi:kinase-like domain-containing protein [Calycina marina]|uniref:Serine/threonine-protein kinase ATG1 n=1 Tax=Calycina marina TaxID=1763456 RepID=A0A9P7Z8K7_9HELO|nr:kinase-like domain-containing protein [Calycina marina]